MTLKFHSSFPYPYLKELKLNWNMRWCGAVKSQLKFKSSKKVHKPSAIFKSCSIGIRFLNMVRSAPNPNSILWYNRPDYWELVSCPFCLFEICGSKAGARGGGSYKDGRLAARLSPWEWGRNGTGNTRGLVDVNIYHTFYCWEAWKRTAYMRVYPPLLVLVLLF